MFGAGHEGTWRWVEFDCQFSWRGMVVNGSSANFVARGNYTVFPGEVI